MRFADFEISLRRWGNDSYAAEARFVLDASRADVALIKGPPAHVPLDIDVLLGANLNLQVYGERLTAMLFADSRMREALSKARVQAQTAHVPLRLRLRLDSDDEILHSVRWESLLDLEQGGFLCASEQLLLSRYLDSADMTPVALRSKGDMTAVVAVAAPTNLVDYRLAAIDVAEEIARSNSALAGLPTTFLARTEAHRPATLNNIVGGLRHGADILYLICHGTLRRGKSFLWLEQEDGSVDRVEGGVLVQRISSLTHRPSLVVLASCKSAGESHEESALAALGPQLASAGIPAVVAMQGNVSMTTVACFMTTFFSELQRDGLIDRAMAAARTTVLDRTDWWMPVLFMRVRDGRIWRERSEPAGSTATSSPTTISVQVGGHVYGQVIVNTGTITNVTPPIVPSLYQLRAPLDDFLGRDEEIALVSEALRPRAGRAALAAIYGMGGLGKTELALHVTRDLTRDYPDAQLFISLRNASGDTPHSLADALRGAIRAFDPNADLPDDPDALAALYRGHLGNRRALVLLDDAPDSATVQYFLPPANCALLVTSRTRIWFKGPGKVISLALFSRDESRILLLNDAPHMVGHPTLNALLEHCGDVPLAVRVAAATLADQTLTPEQYLSRLRDETRRLKTLKYDDVDVYAILGVSDDLLVASNPELARLWRLLGVCPAPFSAATAQAIWDEHEEDVLSSGLEQLTRRSLVRYDAATGQYQLHDLLRDVASARRAQADDYTARLRHGVYYLATYREAQALYEQGHEHALQGLHRLNAAWQHIRAAITWIAATPTSETDKLCVENMAASSLLELRLTPHELEDWHAAGVAAAQRNGDRQSEATALLGQGNGVLLRGEVGQACEHYAKALKLFRSLGDRFGELRALLGWGEALQALGDYPQAEGAYREAMRAAEVGQDLASLARARTNLGNLFAYTSSYDQALVLLGQAKEDFRALGDRRGLSRVLEYLSYAHSKQNNYPAVIACAEEQVQIATLQGDQIALCTAQNSLGMAYWQQGDLAKGKTYFLEQLDIATKIGYTRGVCFAHSDIAGIYCVEANYDQALLHLGQALDAAKAMDDRTGIGTILGNAGTLYSRLGDNQNAMSCLAQALQIVVELGEWSDSYFLFLSIADVYRIQEMNSLAEQLYLHVIKLTRALHAPRVLGHTLHQLACLYVDQERFDEAYSANNEALAIHEHQRDDEALFAAQVLAIHLRHRLSQINTVTAFQEIEALRARAGGDKNMAALYFTMWRLALHREDARLQAAQLYHKLWSLDPQFEYRQRYEKLTSKKLETIPLLPTLTAVPEVIALDFAALLNHALAESCRAILESTI